VSSQQVHLINFNDTSEVDELLRQIGIESGLGNFLNDHLTDVLRKQYSHSVIESIELQGVENCSIEGMPKSEGSTVINMDSLTVPLNVGIVVSVADTRYKLSLHVDIRSESDGNVFNTVTDVFFRDQVKL
jgi:hypothetical protein